MSNRVSGQAFRSALALVAVAVTTISLAGCSSLGGYGFQDPVVTGSTTSVAAGNMNQAMPQPLSVSPSSSARYLPPADIGRRMSGDPFITSGVASSSPNIISQDLPSLKSSPAMGSKQTMPAQLSSAPIDVASNVKPAASKLSIVPQSGYTHVIESGESLYAIARKYNVTTDALVRANGLSSPDKIVVGQKITVPGAAATPAQSAPIDNIATGAVTKTVHPATKIQPMPVKREAIRTKVAAAIPAAAQVKISDAEKFRWPVSGKMVTNFAASKGTGINIEVPEGTAIRAAESGTVIYVGSAVEGYGNLVLIKHSNGYVSAYAHLSQITTVKGDEVMRGDAIGLAGMTGAVTRPQLHFELRQGATPVDPIPLLAS